jgi:glycerol uptake facilitator-like aquaporin
LPRTRIFENLFPPYSLLVHTYSFHNFLQVNFDSLRFDTKESDFHRSLLVIALGDGFAFMCFVFAFQRLSGGHLNPAVTWAALVTRRIGVMKGIAYMLAQVGGGILGALLLSAATPDTYLLLCVVQTVYFDKEAIMVVWDHTSGTRVFQTLMDFC